MKYAPNSPNCGARRLVGRGGGVG